MFVKYGKPVQMRNIGRNLEGIKKQIDLVHHNADRCFVPPKENEAPKCRICQSKEASLFVSVWGKYEYYQCKKCGSIFLRNLPDVKKMYSGTDTMNGKIYIDDALFEQRVEMISKPKVQFVTDLCEKNGKTVSSWLDVGCGGGRDPSLPRKDRH